MSDFVCDFKIRQLKVLVRLSKFYETNSSLFSKMKQHILSQGISPLDPPWAGGLGSVPKNDFGSA